MTAIIVDIINHIPKNFSLAEILENLPQHPQSYSFGSDIDEAHNVLLSKNATVSQKVQCYLDWVSRYQPCLFGRLAARSSKGLSLSVCWISEDEINLGDFYLQQKIQSARRSWKEQAETGRSHGFLVFLNSPRLAFALPTVQLLDVCKHISNLYFTEHRPVETDVIYTEAIPLRDRTGKLNLFKAGTNIFYTGAHKTRNHDRRIPGGLMISVNSIGHYANSLLLHGLASSLPEAIERLRDLAWRSIGNGGIGDESMRSTTWHNHEPLSPTKQCPMKRRPPYIPVDFSPSNYSALYHTDVLVPTSVTIDETEIQGNYEDVEKCPHLSFDYISEEKVGSGHENYGLFHGYPVADEAKYYNPWPPSRAFNESGLFTKSPDPASRE